MQRLALVLAVLLMLGLIGLTILLTQPSEPSHGRGRGPNSANRGNGDSTSELDHARSNGGESEPSTNSTVERPAAPPRDNRAGRPNPTPLPPNPAKSAVLTGQVVDPAGHGIAHAVVLWMPQNSADPARLDSLRKQLRITIRQFEDPAWDEARGMTEGKTLRQGQMLVCRADESGHFALVWGEQSRKPNLNPNAAAGLVLASAPEFAVASMPLAAGTTDPITLTLAARSGLRITVLDSAGQPLPGVHLRVWSTAERLASAEPKGLVESLTRVSSGDQAQLADVAYLQSDANGQARHETSQPSRYYQIVAISSAHRPNALINVSVPAEQTVVQTITLDAGATLTGVVVDHDRKRVPYATVYLVRGGASEWAAFGGQIIDTTDLDGTFALSGLEDREPNMSVMVQAAGFTPQQPQRPLNETERGPIEIVMQRLGVISGRLEDPAGQVIPWSLKPNLSVAVITENDSATGETEDDGYSSDMMKRTVGGNYQIEWYWVNATGQAVDPAGKPDERYEQPGSTGVFTAGGFVNRGRGRQMQGPIRAAGTGTVTPHSPSSARTPQPEGALPAFRVISLPPGRFELTGSATGLAPTKHEPITLVESEWRRHVNLRLVVGAALSGRVTTADGTPAAGATVIVCDRQPLPAGDWSAYDPFGENRPKLPAPPTQTWERAAQTDATGHYEFAALSEGEVEIYALLKGHAPTTSRLSLPAAGGVTHDLVLGRGLTITGQIRLSGGTGAQNAVLTAQFGRIYVYEDFRFANHDWATYNQYYAVTDGERRKLMASMDVRVAADTGLFTVRGLGPGTYTLQAEAVGGTAAHAVASAGDSNVVLTLGAVGQIEGTILGPDGVPPKQGMLTISAGTNQATAQFPWSADSASGTNNGGASGEAIENLKKRSAQPFGGQRRGSEWSFTYDAATGAYRVSNLAPRSSYSVSASSPGFGVASAEGIGVVANSVTRVDLRLTAALTLEVMVHDAAGAAVAGATVMLSPQNEWQAQRLGLDQAQLHPQATTDATGRAVFAKLTWPSVIVIVRTQAGTSAQLPVNVTQEPLVDVRLGRPGVILGVVRDRAGRPMAGTAVYANPTNGWGNNDQQTTNATGEFRIDPASPGNWWISVPALQTDDKDGGGWAAGAKVVVVHEGETVRVEIGGIVVPRDTVSVSGRISRGSKPLAGQVMMFSAGPPMVQKQATVDASGNYKLDLPSGEYLAFLPPSMERRVRFTVPSGVATLTMNFEISESRVSGTVTDAQGQPVRGARIELRKPEGNAAGTDALSRYDAVLVAAQTVSGEGGRYELLGLADGAYELWVRPAMGDDGRGIPVTNFGTINIGVSSGDIVRDIRLDAGGSVRLTLEGFAREAYAQASLELFDGAGRRVPLSDDFWARRSQVTGVTTIPNLAPGSYTLRLHVPGSSRVSERVTVRANSVTELRILAATGYDLTVTVQTPPGGVTVTSWRLRDGDGRDITPPMDLVSILAGADAVGTGRPLAITDLPAGRYTVELALSDGRHPTQSTTVGEGPARIEFDLR